MLKEGINKLMHRTQKDEETMSELNRGIRNNVKALKDEIARRQGQALDATKQAYEYLNELLLQNGINIF